MQDGSGDDEGWLDRTQQMDGPALTPGAPPATGVKLVCVGGPLTGKEFPLNQLDIVLGRTPENAIALPDHSVSRRHAQLRRTPGGWAVSNLSAREGTLVNGYPVKSGEQRVLRGGDILTLGTTALMLVEPNTGSDDADNTAMRTAQLPAALRPELPRTPMARPLITEPEMEPGTASGRTRTEDALENRTVLNGSAPADLQDALENRTVLNGSAPSDLDDALENRTVLDGSYSPHPAPAGGARPPPLPSSIRVSAQALVQHPPRGGLVPLETLVPTSGSRGTSGPPPELEVTSPDVREDEVPPENQTRAVPAVDAELLLRGRKPAEVPLENQTRAVPAVDAELLLRGRKPAEVPPENQTRAVPAVDAALLAGMQGLPGMPGMDDVIAESGEIPRPGLSPEASDDAHPTASLPAAAGWPQPSSRRSRRDSQRRRRRLELFGLGLLALLLGIAPVMGWNFYQARRAQEARARNEVLSRADALFQQGQELMQGGRYAEARAKFLELRQQEPTYPVKEFIVRAEHEAALQNVLNTARDALAKDRLGEAMNWLSRVPEETEQVTELRRLRSAVESRARVRVGEAQAALDADNAEEAIRICDDVLKVLPDNEDAVRVRTGAMAQRL